MSDSTTYTKHTTHTDALDTLGTIIGPNEGRDAIHLAVFPVEAAVTLRPGDHVRLDADGRAVLAPRMSEGGGIGIVDPFLEELVEAGARFWLVVYPRQITSLRHVWEHPAFPPSDGTAKTASETASETKEEAERWIRDWLDDHGDNPGFDAVMAVIRDGSWRGESQGGWDGPTGRNKWGEYIHFDGTDAHGDIPAEFWYHVEVYLGRKIDSAARAEHFSCSC